MVVSSNVGPAAFYGSYKNFDDYKTQMIHAEKANARMNQISTIDPINIDMKLKGPFIYSEKNGEENIFEAPDFNFVFNIQSRTVTDVMERANKKRKIGDGNDKLEMVANMNDDMIPNFKNVCEIQELWKQSEPCKLFFRLANVTTIEDANLFCQQLTAFLIDLFEEINNLGFHLQEKKKDKLTLRG